MTEVLLDSVVLIDHFNGIEAATSYLGRIDHRAAISVITRAEVLTGFADEEHLALATAFLDRFPTLTITEEVADLAARLRREERWKLPDALQAAVALHHGLQLVTRNTNDFSPDWHRFVEVPYRL